MNTQPLTGLFRGQKALAGHGDTKVNCDCCGDRIYTADLALTDHYPDVLPVLKQMCGERICEYCADNHKRCAYCGVVHRTSVMTKIIGDWVCHDEADDFEAEGAQSDADLASNIAYVRARQ